MAPSRNQIREVLEEMRNTLHKFYDVTVPQLTEYLSEYADELDIAYKKIKISKVAGSAGGIVGGTLAVVGFGLSFFTFGASLGLAIAGGVIGGAGGVTAGGASIAEFFKARQAGKKAKLQLETLEKAFNELLIKCSKVAKKLEKFGNIDETFPSWVKFWGLLVIASGKSAYAVGWKLIANTIINGVRLGKAADTARDIASASSAAVRLARPAGHLARGAHIFGGVFSIIFIPVDLYSLVSNSKELHTEEAHGISKRIREIVEEIKSKRSKVVHKIDGMINESIAVL